MIVRRQPMKILAWGIVLVMAVLAMGYRSCDGCSGYGVWTPFIAWESGAFEKV